VSAPGRERLSRPFVASLALHAALVAGMALWAALAPAATDADLTPPSIFTLADLPPAADEAALDAVAVELLPAAVDGAEATALPIGAPPDVPADAPAGVDGAPVPPPDTPVVARDDADDPAPDRGPPTRGLAELPAGGGGAPSPADALALLDEADLGDAATALAGVSDGTGKGVGPGDGPGTGAGKGPGGASGPGGTGTSVDLFPKDVLRGVVAAGIPHGEAAEIKAMLTRFAATRSAYDKVKGGLAPSYATHMGIALGDEWEEKILPSEDRTLGAGVKRWFGDLKHDPLRSIRDVIAAWAAAGGRDPDGGKLDATVGDIADAWEYGRPRGLALVGVRADGSIVGVKWIHSTGTYAFDDALRDAVIATAGKMGPPPPDLVKLTGETWLLYEVTAAITVLPPGPYLAVRTMADFSKPEALYPFKILVNAKANLRGVFDRGEDFDPTTPPEPTVAAPSAR
jgi:hypothetical protein